VKQTGFMNNYTRSAGANEKSIDLDPFISAAEQKQGLPPGLLKQIVDEAGTGISPRRESHLDTTGLMRN